MICRNNLSSICFRIITTVTKGDIDLYVSESWATRPVLQVVAGQNTVVSYKYSSIGRYSDKTVSLSGKEVEGLCVDRRWCYLVVGVYGAHGVRGVAPSPSLALSRDARLRVSDGTEDYQGRGRGLAAKESSFSLLVTYDSTIVSLISGLPLDGYIDKMEGQHCY
jgi:hypothetical protein